VTLLASLTLNGGAPSSPLHAHCLRQRAWGRDSKRNFCAMSIGVQGLRTYNSQGAWFITHPCCAVLPSITAQERLLYTQLDLENIVCQFRVSTLFTQDRAPTKPPPHLAMTTMVDDECAWVLLLWRIDPKARMIRHEASSCPGIFHRPSTRESPLSLCYKVVKTECLEKMSGHL